MQGIIIIFLDLDLATAIPMQMCRHQLHPPEIVQCSVPSSLLPFMGSYSSEQLFLDEGSDSSDLDFTESDDAVRSDNNDYYTTTVITWRGI